MASRIILGQCRSFGTTSQKLSILDYFKLKPKTAVPEVSTKDVIKKVETTELKTERIPIIGRRNKLRDQLWRTKMNGFVVKSWIPESTSYSQLISEQDLNPNKVINDLLLQSYNNIHGTTLETVSNKMDLDDLLKRFELVKQVQIDFGVKISDYDLTKFKNLLKVKQYLQRELLAKKQYNEKEPNAIYLNEEDFKGTNVSIKQYVSKALKEKKFNQILRKAKKLERIENKKIMDAKLQEVSA